ncbi:hypothetical protein CCR75_007346 [Bremia lactucae]|uniref:Uncharacterized protein n=1 Tax=Bremia lactucae TaxID=4779 RepID=A0A976FRC0_BRELC|nr:hypothetical protein CCR75_007346 [Bremia lactucae]
MPTNTYDSWGSAAERFADGSICLGIDLGTTNSCVGMWYVDRNHVKILKNRFDRGRTMPSVVHFDPDSQSVDVGNQAIRLETLDPVGNTIRSIKRLLGHKFKSKATDVARIYASYEVVPTAQQNVAVQVVRSHKKVHVEPEEVSAYILRELKASAEAYFDGHTSLDNVVITVPAYFSDTQRKATITSASMAGFKTVRLLNEPTAAAMAYGLFLSGQKLVTVVDFGGGTLDVSILRIHDGKFEVLGIGGDTHLGGEDINNILLDHVLETLCERYHVTRAQVNEKALVRLKQEVEKAKIMLSDTESVTILAHEIGNIPKCTYTLTRRTFEQVCDPIWTKCLRIVSTLLKEAHVEAADMDEVVLVGGSTRIPILRSKVSAAFNHKELCMSVHADEVVCEGAAIQAAILSGMDPKVFRDVLMMDVLPLPIGLAKADGTMEILLPQNARIPTSVTKYFETHDDGQRGLTIEVYEGHEAMAKDNDHICYFNFALPRNKIGKAGEFTHPVTFTMNASGILQVQAGVHHDAEESPMSKTAIYLMGAYIFALFGLYVFFRIYFVDKRDITA